MMNTTPVMTAIFRVEFILSPLVVIDFGVNKSLTPNLVPVVSDSHRLSRLLKAQVIYRRYGVVV